MKTTLNKLKEANACEDRYEHLLQKLNKTEADDEPLEIKTISKLNGIEDAIWALKTVKGHDREIRLFACDCAESVLYLFEKVYPNDNHPHKAIEVSRLYAIGKATKEELVAAKVAAAKVAYAAYNAANVAYAAKAANAAASAAAYAISYSDAAYYAERKKQEMLLLKYL